MSTLRPLGATGLHVAPLILGGNVFGHGKMDRANSFALLDAYAEAAGPGAAIDTADFYVRYLPGHEGGESESMIGDWLAKRGKRDDVIIVTKVGGPMGEGMEGLGAAYLRQAIEHSLRRLRTDYVDLYFSHMDDAKAPQEETARAYEQLIKSGKVRAIGASNFTPERLVSALETAKQIGAPPYTAYQPHYNLLERDYETSFRDICLKQNLGVMAYFGLAQGYLSGKYRQAADLAKSRRGRGVQSYLDGNGFAMLAAMDEIAAQRGTNLAAIALAWLAAKPNVTPIASATSLDQLRDLAASITLTLTPDEMARLDSAA